MFEEIGELTGIFIIIFYSIAASRMLFRLTYKIFGKNFKKHPKFQKVFVSVWKFIRTKHNLFGLITIALILVHFVIQFIDEGLSITGVIAAVFMICQFGLGGYLTKKKPSNKIFAIIHRILAFIVLVAIIIHVL